MRYPKPNAKAGLVMAGAAAAVGLVAGLAARAGARGVAKAAEPLLGHWLDVIKTEHLEVLEAVEKLEATKPTATARRAALLNRIRLLLTRHAVEEENVLYPALRLGEAEAEAMDLSAEHATVKTALYELERMPAGDPGFKSRVRALRADLESHMHREETEIFPALRQGLSPEEDERLTALLLRDGRMVS